MKAKTLFIDEHGEAQLAPCIEVDIILNKYKKPIQAICLNPEEEKELQFFVEIMHSNSPDYEVEGERMFISKAHLVKMNRTDTYCVAKPYNLKDESILLHIPYFDKFTLDCRNDIGENIILESSALVTLRLNTKSDKKMYHDVTVRINNIRYQILNGHLKKI